MNANRCAGRADANTRSAWYCRAQPRARSARWCGAGGARGCGARGDAAFELEECGAVAAAFFGCPFPDLFALLGFGHSPPRVFIGWHHGALPIRLWLRLRRTGPRAPTASEPATVAPFTVARALGLTSHRSSPLHLVAAAPQTRRASTAHLLHSGAPPFPFSRGSALPWLADAGASALCRSELWPLALCSLRSRHI